MWEPMGLPLGEIGINLSVHVQGLHLQKEAIVIGEPLISVIPDSGIHIGLDQLKMEATPLIHADSNIGVVCLF